MARRHIWIAVLGLFLALPLMGCHQSNQESKEKGPSSTKIIYRLKWLFNASTAGDLWAKETGIFEKYGLDVQVKEGGAEQDAIEEIELGRAQFGIASGDQVLRAVSRGADVLVLAQIFQINPLQWIYFRSKIDLEGLDPTRLKDVLKDLTIGITYGGNDEAIFIALARSLGLDPDKLKLYGITYDYSPFWKGKVDLWPCYRNTQGITLSEKMAAMKDEAGFLDPSRYGISFVANSLITSKRYAVSHPDTVKAFINAIKEGWKQALAPENKDKMASIIRHYEKTLSLSIISRQLQATRDLITLHGTRTIGFIDKDAWTQTEKIMYEQGLLNRRVDTKSLFTF